MCWNLSLNDLSFARVVKVRVGILRIGGGIKVKLIRCLDVTRRTITQHNPPEQDLTALTGKASVKSRLPPLSPLAGMPALALRPLPESHQ